MIHDWVAAYIAAGWAPVRIPPLSKAPREQNWPEVAYTPEMFADGDNVGIKLGAPSGGLVDIDMDCDAAVALAPHYLPRPTLTFGRGGQVRHWLYRSVGARTRKPQATHVELRSTGGQTVFPGSIHESGQPIEFYTAVQPLALDPAALEDAYSRLCAATIIAGKWPEIAGDRHHAVLALAGAMWHDGWSCDDALAILLPPMELATGSNDDHREQAIRATWDPGNDRQRFGWPTVLELFGPRDGRALQKALARDRVTTVPGEARPLTDAGNAERFADDHGATTKHAHGLGWLQWDDTRWAQRAVEPVDLAIASARALQQRGDPALTKWGVACEAAGRIASTLSLASKLPGMLVTVDELDTDPWLLCCTNGVVDLRTGTLVPHDRSLLMTKCTGVPFEATALAPRFVQFLGEIFRGDWDLAAYVLRFLGYSLTGSTREQVLQLWHGHGANGKSTFIDAVMCAAGDYAQALPASLLMERRSERASESASPEVARLRGVRLAAGVETKDGQRWNESLIKQLTGGVDRITARHLYAEPIEFVPTAKLVLAVNHKPLVRGTDHGMWRRIHLVPFDARFEGDRQDRDLPARLAAEAPGILAMLVASCIDWQRRGLQPPPRVLAEVEAYRTGQDVVGAFLAECCKVGDGVVSMAKLYSAYKHWASSAGEHVHGKHAFNNQLRERGYSTRKLATESWVRLELANENFGVML